jgi:hypothetical protein
MKAKQAPAFAESGSSPPAVYDFPTFVPAATAARLLCIELSTLRVWTADIGSRKPRTARHRGRKIKSYKLGSKVVYDLADLKAFVAAGRQG